MIPKSCRLFGQDHATKQLIRAKWRFDLIPFRSKRSYRGLCRPFAFEYMAAGVGRLDPKGAGAIREIAEADIWVLRDRNAALHSEHELVALPDPQIPHEKGRDVKQRDLVTLQARIVRMTDHDLGFAQAARRAVTRSGELPKAHLPKVRAGL